MKNSKLMRRNRNIAAFLVIGTLLIAQGQGCSPSGFTSESSVVSQATSGPAEANSASPGSANNSSSTSFAEILPILQAKCVGCHRVGGSAAFANFDFIEEADFFATPWFNPGDALSPAIVRSIGSGDVTAKMPLSGIPWSEGEFIKLKSWIVSASTTIGNNSGGGSQNGNFDPAFQCKSNSKILPSSIQRLTRASFENSLRDFLSALTSSQQKTILAKFSSDFDKWPQDNSESYVRADDSLTQGHVDAVVDTAFDLATELVGNAVYLNKMIQDNVCGSSATKASLQGACLQSFVRYYGRKAFRRPLSTAEENQFISQFNALTGDDRITVFLASLITHPRFLYPLEIGEGDGALLSGQAGVDATYQLGKYELLSKLTFLYWSAPPDDELYAGVGNVNLNLETELNKVTDYLLGHANAKTGIRSFYREWLKLDAIPVFDNSSPSFKTLASGEGIGANSAHRDQMINEVLDMAEFYTLATAGSYGDLLTSPYSFARGQELAKIYGVPVWNGSSSSLVSFPNGQQRSGLLTKAAFLAASSEYSRPIMKGKLIRTRLLCDEIPAPPPDLEIVPLVQDSASTTRQVVERTTEGQSCVACHSRMNPLGFATENFDSLGRFRATEAKFNTGGAVTNQLAISTSIAANLYPGDTVSVGNAVELSHHIVDSGKGQQCMVKQFFRHVQRRTEDLSADACSLESLRLKLSSSGGSILEMMREVSKQASFRQRKIN